MKKTNNHAIQLVNVDNVNEWIGNHDPKEEAHHSTCEYWQCK